MILFGCFARVGHILAEIAFGFARHHYSDGVFTRKLAENSDESAVFSSAVSVNYAFCSGFFENTFYKRDSLFGFFRIISHFYNMPFFVIQ
ncbi:hypothetical protein SDC9_182900 [bioreactor metagenome]|uniref:Uncharacterized protein n=1 Tax=bioreactor metagenome TaxID=1076179 RepID=A0A645HAL4_9ZZZZ